MSKVSRQKIYFASDFHLGYDDKESSREREKRVVRWLDAIAHDVKTLYLVGDVFDYWFEYLAVVPRGFTRLLGKLAELSDSGVDIHYFIGNHDMWMFQYLEEELNIQIHKKPITITHSGKNFHIAHGDGLGPADHGYKFIKRIFSSPLSQWAFARLHPNLGIQMMRFFSQKSRENTDPEKLSFMGPNREWLVQYANELIKDQKIDYFVFGHRHLTIDYTLKNNHSRYINLGEWIENRTFAVFDGNELTIQSFENAEAQCFTGKNEAVEKKPVASLH